MYNDKKNYRHSITEMPADVEGNEILGNILAIIIMLISTGLIVLILNCGM